VVAWASFEREITVTPVRPSQSQVQTDKQSTDLLMLEVTKKGVAATLAASLMTISGRPHSPDEAAKLCDRIYRELFNEPNVTISEPERLKSITTHK